jgi:cell division protein FtsB
MIQKNRKITNGRSAKESRESVFFSTFIGILAIITIAFMVVSNFKINQKRAELMEKSEELKRQIQILEERNEALQAGIVQAGNIDYWEEKLRERGYEKPEEETVVVLPPEDQQAVQEEESGFWQKLLDKIEFWRD